MQSASSNLGGFSPMPQLDLPIRSRVRARLRAEDRRKTLRNIQLVSILAAILVPLFWVLDLFAYPEHAAKFLVMRLACTALVLIAWQLSRTNLGKKYYRLFTVLIPMIPAFFIALMIGCTRDPGSPYYAGLNLSLVGIGFLFSWTYREALISTLLVLLMYLIACLPGVWQESEQTSIAAFVNNLIFILATGAVITVGSFAHAQFRLREFLGRDQLRRSQAALSEKNTELANLLTELSETEIQLIQSEKMASLGQLSAGLIHEIGNPLNFANQALFLLKRKLTKTDIPLDGAIEKLTDIQEGHSRINEIVSELRGFSHKGKGSHGVFDIENTINSALRMLAMDIENSGVVVESEIEAGLSVYGVKNQLTQVFMNLFQNAIHATDEQVRPEIMVKARNENDQIQISIRDNGCGIAEDQVSKLFDPFYTTKEVGKGTGLGLSISYRIVEAHGGQISVASLLHRYTEFKLNFPLHQATPKQEQHCLAI